MKKLLVIDGNSIVNRAFFGIPLLANGKGEYTNAIFGFLNILFRFIDEEQPTHLAVAFDLPKPTFRHKMFDEYKGTRSGMSDELREQIPVLKTLLGKMNIAMIGIEGYEADDILGTLAHKLENDVEVVIVSGDRDTLQLATERTTILIPKTKAGKTIVERYNTQEVIDLYGVTPREFIDVKALMGDASDNIPGVPSIGEKTATKIIIEYKSIENAIENAENIKPKKASENLITFKEQAILSKELATILLEVPMEIDFESYSIHDMFTAEAYDEIKRLELKSLFKKFESGDFKQEEEVVIEYKVVQPEDILFTVEEISKSSMIYLNIEKLEEEICISIITDNENYVVVENEEFDRMCTKNFLNLVLNLDNEKIFFDLKKAMLVNFELNNETAIKKATFDTVVAMYVINPTKSGYAYNDIALDVLGKTYKTEEDIFGKGKKRNQENREDLYKFIIDHAFVAKSTHQEMLKTIKENDQEILLNEIELPLVKVLADMQVRGMRVDKEQLIAFGEKLNTHIDELTAEIYGLVGKEFNINSPSQLGVILFEELGLKGGKKGKTGYSTSAEVLNKIKFYHPVVPLVLDYRTYTKLKSTYVDGLLNVINEKTGKIHSEFNQTITATGRISSTNPNLQNIPIRTELGRELRKVFIPENEDYVFVGADYSQIELRILAHIADDNAMVEAFNNGVDIHRLTASQVANIPVDEVTPSQRSDAKAVNFGIVYGISSFSLSQDLGISKFEADRYIESYFNKYPNVKKYLDNSVEFAKENGYAQTIFNRKRNILEITSTNFIKRGFGERIAMNTPIQGSAADLIKIAMNKVSKRIEDEKLKSSLVLQIHDELIINTHREEIEIVKTILREEMENASHLKVKLEVDINVGENWYNLK